MAGLRLIIAIHHLFFCMIGSATGNSEPGTRLTKALFTDSGYDPMVRPLRNHRAPINVEVKMNLYQILDVDEANQQLKLYVWMTQEWNDEFLSWNPADYDGIRELTVKLEKVWYPDTCLYNNLEMEPIVTERMTAVGLKSLMPKINATKVRLQYPAIYTVSCRMNILYFPFDYQNCTLVFGSWLFDSSAINFTTALDYVTNESFVQNQEWIVASFRSRRYIIQYSCCDKPFSEIRMDLVIYRKSLYYMVNLVIPQAIITIVAIVGFFTPSDTSSQRTEKVNLGITTLLAMSILMLMVSDTMPTTSSYIPLISWYFLLIILLTSSATVCTSLIILLQRRGQYARTIPTWVRCIFFDYLGPWLRIRPPKGLYWAYQSSIPIVQQQQQQQPANSTVKKGFGRIFNFKAAATTSGSTGGANGTNKYSSPLHANKQPLMAQFVQNCAESAQSQREEELLAMQRAATDTDGGSITTNTADTSPIHHNQSSTLMTNGGGGTTPQHHHYNSHRDSFYQLDPQMSLRQILVKNFEMLSKEIRKIDVFVRLKEEGNILLLEYEYLASIIDRICLILYLSAATIVTVSFIMIGYSAVPKDFELGNI